MHEVASMMHICPGLVRQGLLVPVLVPVLLIVLVHVLVLILVLVLVFVMVPVILVRVHVASDIEQSAYPRRVRYNGDRI